MRVDRDASFAYFVYPFLFESRDFPRIVDAVSSLRGDPGGEENGPFWREMQFPHEDLLAHVRDYINPRETDKATVALWQLSNMALKHYKLHSEIGWRLCTPYRHIPFHFCSRRGGFAVQCGLFRVGVGFLTFQAHPDSEDAGDWLDLLHFFRFVAGQRQVYLEHEHATEPIHFRHILDNLLQHAFHSRTRWWQEVFVPDQLLPYVALYVEEVNRDETPELVYRARNLFPVEREIYPSDRELALDHPALLTYAHQQWFIFSLTGGGFLALDAPRGDFFRGELPERLARQYFLLFLLAQQQRFALMRLSQLVSEHWLRGDEAQRLEHFEYIRLSLLEFTARGYFTQVMQRDQHHRVYARWQEVLQVRDLYQEVGDEVREMHDILQKRLAERVEARLKLLTWVIAFPTLAISFLSINIRGWTAEEGLSLQWALALLASAVSLGILLWAWDKILCFGQRWRQSQAPFDSSS
ncbi:MAG: hypothetical protein RMJ82_03650 [Gemmatales bacterium]|nr:hypothetical protein [Gemmatales bacterium]